MPVDGKKAKSGESFIVTCLHISTSSSYGALRPVDDFSRSQSPSAVIRRLNNFSSFFSTMFSPAADGATERGLRVALLPLDGQYTYISILSFQSGDFSESSLKRANIRYLIASSLSLAERMGRQKASVRRSKEIHPVLSAFYDSTPTSFIAVSPVADAHWRGGRIGHS